MNFAPFAFQQQLIISSSLPNIPTSGLTLWLDAGVPQSYPGTGTNWFDLSGNNNTGVLTNGATYDTNFGGSIFFDGTNDFVSFPSVSGMPLGNSNYTIITFFNSPTGVRRNALILWGTTGSSSRVNAMRTLQSTENAAGGLLNFWWANDLQVNTPISNNTWYQAVATYNGSTRTIYKNNVSVGSGAASNANVTNQSTLTVGRTFGSTFEYMLGNISAVMVYNRSLSNSEITEVWNEYKVRYGFGDINTTGLTINLDANDSASYPGTGTNWFDLSGNNNTAALINGPTFNSVASPNFFQFDGTNDYGTFGTNTIGSNTSSYTFGGWVAPRTGSTEQMIFTRGEDGSGNGWSIMLNKRPSVNIIRAAVVADGAEVNVSAPTTFTNDVWYQYYGVWTPGSSLKLYLNGVLVATTNTTRTTLRSSTVGWRIARYRSTLPLHWQGKIATFNLYNRSLTDEEILNNYEAQKIRYGY